MNEQITSIQTYNPRDHLIKIRTKDGSLKDYYPAAWRLYELNLRYENANFSSEILHMDLERNFVIVKCRLYIGVDYEMASRKTEALKQGLLSQLDKVETAAKARCARDLGISTELALDQEESEEIVPEHETPAPSLSRVPSEQTVSVSVPQASSTKSVKAVNTETQPSLDPAAAKERLNVLYPRAKKLKVCTNEQEFAAYFCKVLKLPAFDINGITRQHLGTIEQDLKSREKQQAAA